MKGLIYNVDGRKILYIGNILPNSSCFRFSKAEKLQEIEYEEIRMIYNEKL